ncbi:hypothetical protein ACV07N_05530 [Roseivirga echinicomitans]
MKHTFAVLFLGFFITGCNITDEQHFIDKNLSSQPKVDHISSKEHANLLDDMQSIVQSGLFVIEVYNLEGMLIETLNNTSDFSNCFINRFDPCHMDIKSIKVEGKFAIDFNSSINL